MTIVMPTAFHMSGRGEYRSLSFVSKADEMLPARSSVRWVSWTASTAILCLFIKPYISNHFSCLKSLAVLTLPRIFSDVTLMWSLEE